MRAIPIDEESGLSQNAVDGDMHRERACLIQAACTLMGADKSLSPEDAVGDVMQIYDWVTEALEKRKARAFSLPLGRRDC